MKETFYLNAKMYILLQFFLWFRNKMYKFVTVIASAIESIVTFALFKKVQQGKLNII